MFHDLDKWDKQRSNGTAVMSPFSDARLVFHLHAHLFLLTDSVLVCAHAVHCISTV